MIGFGENAGSEFPKIIAHVKISSNELTQWRKSGALNKKKNSQDSECQFLADFVK